MALDSGWGGITQQVEPRRSSSRFRAAEASRVRAGCGDHSVLKDKINNRTQHKTTTEHHIQTGERWTVQPCAGQCQCLDGSDGRMGGWEPFGPERWDMVPDWVKAG